MLNTYQKVPAGREEWVEAAKAVPALAGTAAQEQEEQQRVNRTPHGWDQLIKSTLSSHSLIICSLENIQH
jgi:hypothetical protein